MTLVQKEISIIDEHPSLLRYFREDNHPEFYRFILKKTNQLLEEKFYKEALRLYKLLTLYNKDNEVLYENYKKAYVFYTSHILAIKKAIATYKQGNILEAKKKLKTLEKSVPPKSQLSQMVHLGQKEIEKRIYEDFVVPGVERIDAYLAERQFENAKGYLEMLRKLISEEYYRELKQKIKEKEIAYYLNTAQESFERKNYDRAIKTIGRGLEVYPDNLKLQEMLNYYKEAKVKATLQAEAYQMLKQGNYYFQKGDYSRALFYYNNYMGFVTEDPEIQRRMEKIRSILEEEKRKNYFYSQFRKAVQMVDDKQYENAMDVFQNIKTYPYEQDRVREYIAKIEAELEKIRQEKEKESLARNYLNQGNQKFNQRSYQEALDNYVLALSILEEIDGRENLKLEAKHFIQKTRKILKELEREKARERIRKIEEGIERGRREYILGNYTKSIFYLQEVLQLDPQNLVAQNYLDLAQEAQRIESIGKIDPRDPFYSIYLSLKSEGLSLQGKADNLYKQGDKEKGKELFQEALNKWQTIKRAFPYNEEARKNIRYILRYIDPEGWKAAIQEDLDKALQLAEAGNKAAAYEIVKEVREEAPGFPRINYYLKKTEPEKKEKKLSENEKREVARRYNQALSLFTRREYREALKLTENIIRENRYVKEEESVEKVKSLYLKIKNMLETERTKTTDLTMDAIIERTKYYRQALSFYQKGEYQNAINLSRKALQIDPSYNSAKNLLSSARKRLNL